MEVRMSIDITSAKLLTKFGKNKFLYLSEVDIVDGKYLYAYWVSGREAYKVRQVFKINKFFDKTFTWASPFRHDNRYEPHTLKELVDEGGVQWLMYNKERYDVTYQKAAVV